jgi:hypothetical protein
MDTAYTTLLYTLSVPQNREQEGKNRTTMCAYLGVIHHPAMQDMQSYVQATLATLNITLLRLNSLMRSTQRRAVCNNLMDVWRYQT